MKSLIALVGAACVALSGVAACSDDEAAPATSAGGGSKGGASGTAGGGTAGGVAGHGGAGKGNGGTSHGGLDQGGADSGGSATAGTSSGGSGRGGSSGAGQSAVGGDSQGGAADGLGGAAGDTDRAGAGGEGPSEPPPFPGPYAAVYAAPIQGVDTRFPKQAVFRDAGLIRWISEFEEDHDMGTAKNLNVGIDGVVQWGRWADGALAGNDGISVNANQGFHYAIGALSPALPATGNQSYVLVGATPVTLGDGSADVGTATASATAAFGATTAVGVSIALSIDGVTYTVVSTGGTATPASSEVTAWDADHPTRIGGVPLKPTTGICADGCNLSVQGFFAGTDAAQLALVVHVFDGDGGSPSSLSSVLVLEKQ